MLKLPRSKPRRATWSSLQRTGWWTQRKNRKKSKVFKRSWLKNLAFCPVKAAWKKWWPKSIRAIPSWRKPLKKCRKRARNFLVSLYELKLFMRRRALLLRQVNRKKWKKTPRFQHRSAVWWKDWARKLPNQIKKNQIEIYWWKPIPM